MQSEEHSFGRDDFIDKINRFNQHIELSGKEFASGVKRSRQVKRAEERARVKMDSRGCILGESEER